MTRQQVKENRLKFANGLLEPHRSKSRCRLEGNENPNSRCCLGHGCNIFGITRNIFEDGSIGYGEERNSNYAPKELIDLIGLWSDDGRSNNYKALFESMNSLVSINDTTLLTTQQIGQLILDRSWIEGGEDTPFKPLSDYPEE